MLKRPIFLFGFTLLAFSLSSWTSEIIKPEPLKRAQESQKADRSKPNAKTRDGYSVLLLFTDDKTAADNIKKKFDNQFERKYLCNIEWHEPKFKVFAGSFLTRAEAVALLYKVRGSYPNVMIVKNKI